jgi:hypothetical protein
MLGTWPINRIICPSESFSILNVIYSLHTVPKRKHPAGCKCLIGLDLDRLISAEFQHLLIFGSRVRLFFSKRASKGELSIQKDKLEVGM